MEISFTDAEIEAFFRHPEIDENETITIDKEYPSTAVTSVRESVAKFRELSPVGNLREAKDLGGTVVSVDDTKSKEGVIY